MTPFSNGGCLGCSSSIRSEHSFESYQEHAPESKSQPWAISSFQLLPSPFSYHLHSVHARPLSLYPSFHCFRFHTQPTSFLRESSTLQRSPNFNPPFLLCLPNSCSHVLFLALPAAPFRHTQKLKDRLHNLHLGIARRSRPFTFRLRF